MGAAHPAKRTISPSSTLIVRQGSLSVVRHLVELGHEQIALILPPPEMAFTEYRHRGYREGLSAAGLAYRDDYVTYGDLQRAGGYQQANVLLEAHPEITAIVACNDLMALGAMHAAQERGLEVGVDLSITGFDDIPVAEYAHPPLTTVHQPIYEIGRRLAELLSSLIDGEAQENTQILLSSTLMIRASTGRGIGRRRGGR